MNDEILSRCGYRCDLCLAYRPNVEKNPENQQKLSDGWYKYFWFRIPPEDILCDGCMADQPKLIDQHCPVRPCVIAHGLVNCSQCDEYGCGNLQERWVVFDEIQEKRKERIPSEDRQLFLLPYENKKRFDDLRNL